MTGFKVVPKIELYTDFDEFVRMIGLSDRDLILTDRCFVNMLSSRALPCRILAQDDFGPGEPSCSKITAILAEAQKSEYNRVIAIGGGTAIDISKILTLDSVTDLTNLFTGKIPVRRTRKLVIVPTTCGTGSEVTNISIVAFEQLGTKMGLANDALYADIAALVPEFLKTLPYRVFVFSSVDALIHAIESYLSPKANVITRFFSVKAIQMILSGYLQLQQKGNEYRSEIIGDFLLASTYAGIAFSNAGCGLVHAMSYPLSGEYHLAHGEANHQLLLAVLKYYEERKFNEDFDNLYRVFAGVFGCDESEAGEKFSALIRSLIDRKPLSTYGADAGKVRAFAEQVIKTQQRLLANAYVAADVDAMTSIYQELI